MATAATFDSQVPHRRPQNDFPYLWLRSAIIVCFIVMMRLLQQQADIQDAELFPPLVIRVDSTAPLN